MYRFVYIFGVAFVLLAEIACSQVQKPRDESVTVTKDERIVKLTIASEAMLQALKAREFEKFVDTIFPEVINQSGGREKFISILRETYGPTLESFSSVDMSLQEPERLLELENKLFGVVPFRIEGEMVQNRNHVVSQSFVIGVSTDNGVSWKFVSNRKSFFEIFPRLVGKITIPSEKITVNGVEQ